MAGLLATTFAVGLFVEIGSAVTSTAKEQRTDERECFRVAYEQLALQQLHMQE